MHYSPHQYASVLHELISDAPAAKRREVIREFLDIVAKNNSLSLLPEITREYGELRDREKKVRQVTVRAPERLPESGVARRLWFKAKINSVRDVRLLGGAVVEVDGLRVDNSVRMRMERARKALKNN
jgi:F0F1-type ATP synthase delta subunit